MQSLKKHIKAQLKKNYSVREIETALLHAGFDKQSINKAFIDLGVRKKGFFEKMFEAKEVKKPEPKKPVPKPIPPPPKPKPAAKKPKESLFKKLFAPAPKKPALKKIPPPPKPKKVKPKKVSKKPGQNRLFIKIMAGVFLILFFAIIGVIIWMMPAACATEACFVRHADACQAATFSNIIEGTTVQYETNNCVLKKTVMSLAPDEPQEIVEAFLGKSMYCMYAPNDFSPLYINTLSGMLGTCEGELKQAMMPYITSRPTV